MRVHPSEFPLRRIVVPSPRDQTCIMRLLPEFFLSLILCAAPHVKSLAQSADFASPIDYEIGGTAYNVEAADFNNDGALDLVASSHAADGFTVLLNDGEGSFGQRIDQEVVNAARGLAIGDFDNDGHLDVVVAANLRELYMLPGSGDGTFGDPQISEGVFSGNAYELAAADFDGDGVLDVAALGASWLLVHIGDGDGGFALTHAIETSDVSIQKCGLVAADLNGDGFVDLAAANGDGEVVLALNDGEGNLSESARIPTSTDAFDVAAGDFDGDGDLDLAATGFGATHILINLGDGAFEASSIVSTSQIAWNLNAADLNLDGDLDLVLVTGSEAIQVLYGLGDGTFEPSSILSTLLSVAYDVIGRDLNGDGREDLVATDASVTEGRLSVRMNTTVAVEPAVAVTDNYSVDEGETLQVAAPGVLVNDSGTPPLMAAVLDNPSNGEVALNADGSFTYFPAPDFSGEDSFTYRLTDNDGRQDDAIVAITVNMVDDSPEIEPLLLRADDEESGREEYIIRQRRAIANLDHLEEMAAGAGGEILLNFFDDVEVVVHHTDAVWRSETAFTWYGRFTEFEQDHVLLVVNLERETVTGNATVNGRNYQIRPAGDVHETREIDQSAFPEGEDFTLPEDNTTGKTGGGAAVQGGVVRNADAHPIIDILVVYTDDVARASSDISSEIQLAIDETNLGFSQSGVNAEVRLVGAEEVSYRETQDGKKDRNRLQDPSDGFLDEVHTAREEVGADVVGLWMEVDTSRCGIAFLMEEVDVSFKDWAFFVVRRSCATGNYTFGHELGHVMGARHDRFVDDVDGKPYDYNHGYVLVRDGWRTIMAYNDACDCSDESDTEPDTCPESEDRKTSGPTCERLLFWSDPTNTYNEPGNGQAGGAMGIASGDDAADNVRALNNTAATVAAFMDKNAWLISGQVRHRDSGDGIEGVVMDGFPVSAITTSAGSYESVVPGGWSGIVTPIHDLFRFNPPQSTFSDVGSDIQQDFTAIPPPAITGMVREEQTNDPIVGAVLLGLPDEAGDVQTNTGGEYEIPVPFGWSGTITPLADGYNLSPVSRTYEDVFTDQTDQDYSGRPGILAQSDWPLFGRNQARSASGSGSPIKPTLKWSVDFDIERPGSPVVGPGGHTYVVGSTGELRVFDRDGNEQWTARPTSFSVSPGLAVGAGGVAYLVQASSTRLAGQVTAVKPDGTNWSVPFSNDRVGTAPNLGESGLLYIGTDGGSDGGLVALDVADGSEDWKFTTPAAVVSSPTLGSDGTIYFGSNDGYVYAVDEDGLEKWRFETGGGVKSSPAVGPDGTIYVGSDDFRLYAINPDGSEKWQFRTGDRVQASPAIGPQGLVYFGSFDGYLYAVNSDGDELWRFNAHGRIRSSPAVTTQRSPFDPFFPGTEHTESVVYVGSGDGHVYAVNAGGTFSLSMPGSKRWSYDTGNPVEHAPAVAFTDNTLYFSSGNTLYAFGEESEDGTGLIQYTTLGTAIDPELLELKDNIHILVTFDGANGFGDGAILGGLPDDPCQGGPLFIPDCEELHSGFGALSPLVDVPAGTALRIGFAEAGAGQAILEGDLTGLIGTYAMALQPDETYKGILAGTTHPELLQANPDGRSTALTVFSVPTDGPADSGIPVYAGHFSTDLPSVQVTLRGSEVHTFETLSYGEFSEVTSLSAGEYVAEVILLDRNPAKANTDGRRLFFPVSLNEQADGLLGVLLSGFLDPDVNLGGPAISAYQSTNEGATAISALSQKMAARDIVAGLIPTLPQGREGEKLRELLGEALDHVDASLAPDLWIDERHLEPDEGESVFDEEKDAVRELTRFVDIGSEWTPEALLSIRHLVVADQVLAGVAIEEGAAGCEKSDCGNELEKAREAWSEAQRLLSDEQYEAGVSQYAKAWEAAQKALNEMGNGDEGKGNGKQSDIPTAFAVDRNYPNPFNPLTTIGYSLPVEIDVQVEVFDPLGRRVAMLVDERQPAGRHEVTFDSGRLASGVYLYRVTAGSFVETRSMALLR